MRSPKDPYKYLYDPQTSINETVIKVILYLLIILNCQHHFKITNTGLSYYKCNCPNPAY